MPSEIMVVGDGYKFPFSKGILTRSIMSTGIHTEYAYGIAKELESHFHSQGKLEVKREEIRSFVYEALCSKISKDCADRYLLWQSFGYSHQSLIFLIAGTSGTGKSTVSAALAQRLGITHVIGTDTIREVIRMDLPVHKYPVIHQSSYTAHKAIEKKEGSHADHVISGFEQQLKLVNPGINAVINRSLVEGISIVVEGIHIVPGYVKYLESKYVLPYVIGVSDEAEHLMRIKTRGIDNKERNEKKYLDHFSEIRIIQEFLYAQAVKHDIPLLEHKTVNKTIDLIYDDIMSRIRSYMV